jgi:hypothetical protein
MQTLSGTLPERPICCLGSNSHRTRFIRICRGLNMDGPIRSKFLYFKKR